MLIRHYKYMVLLPSSVILLTVDEDTVYEDHSKVRNQPSMIRYILSLYDAIIDAVCESPKPILFRIPTSGD